MDTVLSSFKWLLILALILGWVAVASFNMDLLLSFTLLPGLWEFTAVPLWQFVFWALFSTVVVFALVGMIDRVNLKVSNRNLRKELDGLRKEVHALRNLPLDNPDSSGPIPAKTPTA